MIAFMLNILETMTLKTSPTFENMLNKVVNMYVYCIISIVCI